MYVCRHVGIPKSNAEITMYIMRYGTRMSMTVFGIVDYLDSIL
jgi:hypothetical protein